MKYTMTSPCDQCPFLDNEQMRRGFPLRRLREFASGEFPCHQTANGHIYAHRLSWEIHYGPVPDGLFVCHRCDNPSCVRPDHLFVGTHQDNVDDCVAKGRHLAFRPRVHGSRAGSAKLTEAQVVTIRQSYGTNGLTRRQLGQRYGVDKTTIDRILAKKIWRYV